MKAPTPCAEDYRRAAVALLRGYNLDPWERHRFDTHLAGEMTNASDPRNAAHHALTETFREAGRKLTDRWPRRAPDHNERASLRACEAQMADVREGGLGSRFVIGALLGRGGCGAVFEAHDREANQRVALKVWHRPAHEVRPCGFGTAEHAALSTFEGLSLLDHPNLIKAHAFGVTGGRAWVALEFVDGSTIKRRVAEGAISIPDALSIARAVTSAMAHAHERGVAGADLAPHNIMVARAGEVKVVDLCEACVAAVRPQDDGLAKRAAGDVRRFGLSALAFAGSVASTPVLDLIGKMTAGEVASMSEAHERLMAL